MLLPINITLELRCMFPETGSCKFLSFLETNTSSTGISMVWLSLTF